MVAVPHFNGLRLDRRSCLQTIVAPLMESNNEDHTPTPESVLPPEIAGVFSSQSAVHIPESKDGYFGYLDERSHLQVRLPLPNTITGSTQD